MRCLRREWVAGLTLAWMLTANSHGSEPGRVAGQVTLTRSGQPVAQAVVYLAAQTTTPPAAQQRPIIVDVARGRLGPRVQVGRSGSTFILQNSDPTLRMIRVEEIQGQKPPRLLQRIAMPYAGFERSFRLPSTGNTQLLRVLGDNQQNLGVAYVTVIPHDWAAVTRSDGTFVIGGVPPGTYPLYVWDERHGTLRGEVSVRAGRTINVRLAFPPGSRD